LSPLEESEASLDANVILDFYLTGNADVLEQALTRRMLVSDFVEAELTKSNAAMPRGSKVVCSNSEEELIFFGNLRRSFTRLSSGEIGAITVAYFHSAIFVGNDALAQASATNFAIDVSGSLGILRAAVSVRIITPARAIEIMDEMIFAGTCFSTVQVDKFRASMLGS
jgi:predicted nucleic acid-binding protein